MRENNTSLYLKKKQQPFQTPPGQTPSPANAAPGAWTLAPARASAPRMAAAAPGLSGRWFWKGLPAVFSKTRRTGAGKLSSLRPRNDKKTVPFPRTPACPGLGIQWLLPKSQVPKLREISASGLRASRGSDRKYQGSLNGAEGDSLNSVSVATKPASSGCHPCPLVTLQERIEPVPCGLESGSLRPSTRAGRRCLSALKCRTA